jgi:hypothetical protein
VAFEQRRQGISKQCLCMLIFFRQRRIGDVTGNHHQIRTRRQPIWRVDRARLRRRDINAAVGERARLRDVQVEDLSDENGARGQLRSPADRRYATA